MRIATSKPALMLVIVSVALSTTTMLSRAVSGNGSFVTAGQRMPPGGCGATC
jgi:hypothetical protein